MNDIAEVTEANSISNSAVLVELNISVWGASRLDRAATDAVVANAGAVTNAAQVRKDILAGTTIRKDIADYAAGCRMWHNRQTMPWSDKGSRLLPTSAFLEYKTEANNRKADFENLVQTFLLAYPQLVADAQARMGKLFDPTDYPDATEIASKFDFKLVFSPVPSANDFRVDVGNDAMAEMRENYEGALKTRVEAAMKEPWDRLHDMLLGMSAKMVEDDTPRTRTRKGIVQEIKRPYHESFITNAQAMCKMLTHLNITKNPELERARLALEDTIFGVDIDAVRENPDVRAEIKSKVDAILTTNQDFW